MRALRHFSLAVLIVAFTGLAGPAQQKKDKDQPKPGDAKEPEKKKSNEVFNGKTLFEWTNDLKNTDPSVRGKALAAIKVYGAAGQEYGQTVSQVIKALGDADVSIRVNAAITLGFIGLPDSHARDGVRALMALLNPYNEKQSIVRFQALRALGRIGSAGTPEVFNSCALAISLLKDPCYEVRAAAANALGNIAWDPDGSGFQLNAYHNLLSTFNDSCAEVRLQAVVSIIVVGRKMRETELVHTKSALLRLTSEKQPDHINIWARVALMQIENTASEQHLLAIVKYLKSKALDSRIHASRALATLGMLKLDYKSRVKDLIEVLDNKKEDATVKYWAISALGNLYEEAKESLPVLRGLDKDPDPLIPLVAKEAIEKITTKRRDVADMADPKKKKQ
jgi:HEAT repeat protein